MNNTDSFNRWLEGKMSNGQTRKEFLEYRWGDKATSVINDIFWAYSAGYSNRVIDTRYTEI